MANNIPSPYTGSGSVTSVTAANASIAIGGTAAAPTVAATGTFPAPDNLAVGTSALSANSSTDVVTTAHNTLDDGGGNVLVTGNDYEIRPGSGTGAMVIQGFSDGNQYSNFVLGDNVFPRDQNPGGHYWAFSMRANVGAADDFWIFNYNGAGTYTNVLQLTESASITNLASGSVLDDGTGNQSITGNIDIATAGKGLKVKEGSNAKQGTATLTSGAATVANTSVTSTSRIFLTAQDNSSTGTLRVSARTAGTGFTITSSNGADSGVVAYEIFEQG